MPLRRKQHIAGELEKPFVLIRLRDASQPHWPNLLLLLLEPWIRVVFPLKEKIHRGYDNYKPQRTATKPPKWRRPAPREPYSIVGVLSNTLLCGRRKPWTTPRHAEGGVVEQWRYARVQGMDLREWHGDIIPLLGLRGCISDTTDHQYIVMAWNSSRGDALRRLRLG
ncbi:hypothetical protein B0H13DRAFT_1862927 [Mycena leptocephala]|nr:hypothetical protein B0H13DRAFT_1862927 [Mycena leptocephala]